MPQSSLELYTSIVPSPRQTAFQEDGFHVFFTMGSIHLPIRNGEMARLPPNYLTPPGKARINGWKPYLPQALRE